jgi:hypothetical protein
MYGIYLLKNNIDPPYNRQYDRFIRVCNSQEPLTSAGAFDNKTPVS